MSIISSKQIVAEIYAFSKAQFSAFLGGIVDYLTMLLFAEVVGIHYTGAIVVGGFVGAIVNFRINKSWTFQTVGNDSTGLLLKFMLVVIGSVILKSTGTLFLTEIASLDYRLSRIVIDAIVCFGSLVLEWDYKSNLD